MPTKPKKRPPATRPMPSHEVSKNAKGQLVPTAILKPSKPHTAARLKRFEQREARSEKANRHWNKLLDAIREATEAAEALVDRKNHSRGCRCRVCVCGPESERDVRAVGGACQIFGDTLDGY